MLDEHPEKCAEGGCVHTCASPEEAMALGWDLIEGELYCSLHRQVASRRALQAIELRHLRDRAIEFRRARNHLHARQGLSEKEYRKWDEFQSDLANFHKKHGKLAPEVLRTLDHVRWLKIYQAKGKIDVEGTSAVLFEKEAKANATRDWLFHRLD